jgi:hypothetical protein
MYAVNQFQLSPENWKLVSEAQLNIIAERLLGLPRDP